MKTIRFRGKDKKTGEWCYGSYSPISVRFPRDRCADRHYIFNLYASGGMLYVGERHMILEETLGQYTELKDKDGHDIYEGDIVECVSWNEFFSGGSGKPFEPFRRKMVVKYCNGGFKMIEQLPEPMKPNVWDIISNGDITVIGNLYDNPELLESKTIKEE